MRRDQTGALAAALRRLTRDRDVWLQDACVLEFAGLDPKNHGFEHPALYEFQMILCPGEVSPLAPELAADLGMTRPSLTAGDCPTLQYVVDPQWNARHPAIKLELTVLPWLRSVILARP